MSAHHAEGTNTDNTVLMPHERKHLYRLSLNVGTVLVSSYDNEHCHNETSETTISLFSYTNRVCSKKPTQKVAEWLFFCSSADVCVASYQQLNPLAHILKGFMVLSLCLEAATDPPSKFCMRSGDKWWGLECTSKGNGGSHSSQDCTAVLLPFCWFQHAKDGDSLN